MKILVEQTSGSFIYSSDVGFLCSHEQIALDPACCNGYGDEGHIDCACRGQDGIICLNPDCTGIEAWEVGELMGRLT